MRWLEVWTQPGAGTFERKIAFLPVHRAGFNRRINGVGTGSVTIPAAYDRLLEVIDPDNDVGSLVRFYEGVDGPAVNVYSFFANEVSIKEGEGAEATIAGPGIESGLEHGIAYPWDWPKSPTVWPDHVYGLGSNLLGTTGSFEDDPLYPLENGGAEDGELGAWGETGGSGFVNPDGVNVIEDAGNALSGDWYFFINPDRYHSGIRQTMKVWPGRRNSFVVRMQEPTADGKRYTAGVQVGSGSLMHHTNGFRYSGYALAELDNVARNPSGNGTPGGSSDGTWQQFDLDVTWGDDQDSTTLVVQFDHHKLSEGPNYKVDDVTMAGFGVGLQDWVPIGVDLAQLITWEVSTDEAHTGTHSMKMVQGAGVFGAVGTYREVNVEPGVPHVGEIWVRTPDAGTPTVRFTIQKAKAGGEQLATVTADLVQDVWTKLEVTFEPVGSNKLVWFVMSIDEATAQTMYFDDGLLRTGLPAASPGYIADEQLDLVLARSALTWLRFDSFSATVDSNGVGWDDLEMGIRVSRGQSMMQVLSQIGEWGYEWEVVPNPGFPGEPEPFELTLYNKEGMGTDRTAMSTPQIVTGKSFIADDGLVRLRDPGPNTVLGEGLEGIVIEDQDTGLEAAYGRRESYVPQQTTDANVTVQSLLDTALVNSLNQRFGIKGTVFDPPFPGVEFFLGDKINVNIPPHLAQGGYRVVGYSGTWDFDENHASYSIDFSTQVFDEPHGGTTSTVTSEAVNRLLSEFKGMPEIDPLLFDAGGHTPPFTGPIEVTILVASSEARPEIIALADYVCDGLDDQVEIQNALDDLPAGTATAGRLTSPRGRVICSEGGFNCDGDIEVPGGAALEGVGMATLFYGGNLRFLLNGESELGNFSYGEQTARTAAQSVITSSGAVDEVMVHDIHVFSMLSPTDHLIEFSASGSGGWIWNITQEVGIGVSCRVDGDFIIHDNRFVDGDVGVLVENGNCDIYDNEFDLVTTAIQITTDFADVWIGPNIYRSVSVPFLDADTDVVTTRFANTHEAVFAIEGVVAASTVGVSRFYFKERAFVLNVSIACDTAGTGAGLTTVDANLDGVTIFTDQNDRPTLAAGENFSGKQGPAIRNFASGDYLTVDVDTVNGTTPPEDMTIFVKYVELADT